MAEVKALKNTVPLTFVSPPGVEEEAPGLTSFTMTVPASVPSLFQSSIPLTPSDALKKSVPWTFVRLAGAELPTSGVTSMTRTLPASVPSLFHNS